MTSVINAVFLVDKMLCGCWCPLMVQAWCGAKQSIIEIMSKFVFANRKMNRTC